jgi:hypothetical protein
MALSTVNALACLPHAGIYSSAAFFAQGAHPFRGEAFHHGGTAYIPPTKTPRGKEA